MKSFEYIKNVFTELNSRYDKISHSTIRDLMRGKVKVGRIHSVVVDDATLSPNLDEAETAFRLYNCAIFTAFRGGFTLSQNLERNAHLKAEMEELGLYYRPVKGCYKEAGMEYPDIEYCFFVYNKDNEDDLSFFTKAYYLAEEFDQDSFLYKRSGLNMAAFLIATNDDAREYLHGDVFFTGRYFSNVDDVVAWTDCRDGRFSFMLKGMILISTNIKKVKIGEGNLFEPWEYNADAIAVIRESQNSDLESKCRSYDQESTPLFQHVFKKENQTEEAIHDAVYQVLKKARDSKCKRIGFHCSAHIDGSSKKAAEVAYESIKSWAKRFNKKFEWIVIADIYGDFNKVLNYSK